MADEIGVIGVGAGGHARVVLEALEAMGGVVVVALLDPRRELHGTRVLGVPVVGGDDEMGRYYDDGVTCAFIGLGGADDTRPRQRLYSLVRSRGFDVVSVVHPRAAVSPSAELGPGATVLAGAVMSTCASTGENVTVNTGAIVEHDCRLGDHVHVATGARLASGVTVEDGVHVGAGATVIQEVTIGAGAVVGAGAAVVDDVEPGIVVVGVPARVLRRAEAR